MLGEEPQQVAPIKFQPVLESALADPQEWIFDVLAMRGDAQFVLAEGDIYAREKGKVVPVIVNVLARSEPMRMPKRIRKLSGCK